MNEHQVDAKKVIESLLRQVAEYAQKAAILEAMLAEAESSLENNDGN